MTIGISDLKNSLYLFFVGSLLLFSSCKNNKKDISGTQEKTYNTNIRFSTKEDGYKEKTSYKRLKTNKTEITSTIIQME